MSTQATSWAVRQDAGDGFGAKLLLMLLAEAAGKDGVTIVGRMHLAEACGTDRPATISELFARLEALDLVKRVERRRGNGSRTSDWTVLAPNAIDRGEMADATTNSDALERPLEVVAIATRGTVPVPERGTESGPDEAEVRSGERMTSGTVSVSSQVRSAGSPDPLEEPSGEQGVTARKRAVTSPEEKSPSSISPRRELIELSHRLADGIRLNDAKARVKPDSKTWLEPLRLLVDVEGRSVEEIRDVIDWTLADEFNRMTVLSPRKLKERFGELAQKAGVAQPGESTSGLKLGNFRRSKSSVPLEDCPTTPELVSEWEPICAELRAAVDDSAFIWLAPLHLHNAGNELVLGCPAESKVWIRDRFGRLIEQVAEKSILLVACGCENGAVAA